MEKLYPWRIGAINEILSNCLVYSTNIDKALKTCFKSSTKLGKKDRTFITEHTFNILRNLYQHECSDLNEAIEKYFDSKGFDLERLDAIPNTLSLDTDDFNSQYSVPNWVLQEFSNDNEAEVVETVFGALNHRKQAFIRVNTNEVVAKEFLETLKTENIAVVSNNEAATSLTIAEDCIVALSKSDNYNRGYYEYQDLGSQSLLDHILPTVKESKSILDLCAGEGGKSVQLAQHFLDAERFSFDIVSDKTKHLKRRFERFKNTKCPVILSKEELKEKNDFDFVLIDAPCSGTGTFGRLPSQKYHLTERHFEEMQRTQQHLLEDASNKIVDGGFLAYSTCSILNKENQVQVQNFLEKNTKFTLITEKQFLPTNEHDGLYVALMQMN